MFFKSHIDPQAEGVTGLFSSQQDTTLCCESTDMGLVLYR